MRVSYFRFIGFWVWKTQRNETNAAENYFPFFICKKIYKKRSLIYMYRDFEVCVFTAKLYILKEKL